MSKRVKNRVILGLPHPSSAVSVSDPKLFPSFKKPAPKMQFYEHDLNRPMTILTVFEMEDSKRKEYLEMFNTRFGFELQDYMDFFRTDKVTMYNILTAHKIKLKPTGGMSGAQEREWKKFLAKSWEQPCRPIEIVRPVLEEIQRLMGPKINGKDPKISDDEIKRLYFSEKIPSTSSVLPTPPETKLASSGTSPTPPIPPKTEPISSAPPVVKKIIVSNFNDPDVELRLSLRLSASAAEELIDYLFEQKYSAPGKIKTVSIILPQITPFSSH